MLIWSVCVVLCVVLACQGMGRKTYHPDALIDIESVIGLAHNDSFQPNTTEYIRRYGTKVRTNKTSTNVEAVMEKTCIGWRQTASCRPNGRRESRHDRPCHKIVPKGASGFCACGGGRKVQMVGCLHLPFRCDEECRAEKPVSKALKGGSKGRRVAGSRRGNNSLALGT